MKVYFLMVSTIVGILFLSSCDDNEMPASALAVEIETTESSLERTYTTINIRGQVLDVGNQDVIERGVCWSLSENPDINDAVITEDENTFESTIGELLANTQYYFRVFVTTETGTVYSEQKMFSTLSLEGTSWEFMTHYYPNDFVIHSKVDFLNDNTTVYDELDLPGHCPGCFVTYGTWTLDGNDVTYIWEGSDGDNSTYIYYGTLSGMEMTGTYDHTTLPDDNWNAIVYE